MSIHVALHHRTSYRYEHPVTLGPQVVRLRPAPHARTRILGYTLKVQPENHFIDWQQDPFANYQARLVFPDRIRELAFEVEVIAGMRAYNPFDFFVEEYAAEFPFACDAQLRRELIPYLEAVEMPLWRG